MKHCLRLTIFIALLALLPGGQNFAQELSNNFSSEHNKIIIEGRLTGVENGTPISLMREEGAVGTEVAKDSVLNGRFHIEFTPEDTLLGNYSLMSFSDDFPSMALKLWARAGNSITITGSNTLLYTWLVKSDIKEQKEWSYFINANKKLWDEYQKKGILRKGFMQTAMDDKSTAEKQKAAQKSVDSLDKVSNLIEYDIQKRNLALLERGKMTPTRLEVLNGVADQIKWNHIEEFRAPVTKIYKALNADLKNSVYGQKLAITLYAPKIIKPGDYMYDTELVDTAGNLHHLADFKGSYILLDFWSFGCGPCHASIPELKEITKKLKDKLTVVSLSSDTKKIWKKATEYFKLTGNNFSDLKEDRGIYARYGIAGIPHYVLISPEGIIKSAWTGYGKGSIKIKLKELTGLTVD